jgi:hypothetical protein
MSADPAFEALSAKALETFVEVMNPYAYAMGNPLTLADPSGLQAGAAEDFVEQLQQTITDGANNLIREALERLSASRGGAVRLSWDLGRIAGVEVQFVIEASGTVTVRNGRMEFSAVRFAGGFTLRGPRMGPTLVQPVVELRVGGQVSGTWDILEPHSTLQVQGDIAFNASFGAREGAETDGARMFAETGILYSASWNLQTRDWTHRWEAYHREVADFQPSEEWFGWVPRRLRERMSVRWQNRGGLRLSPSSGSSSAAHPGPM